MPSPPDAAQRAEALDPARSFIVEAPAGSGKTSLLVQRYLRLLSLVDRPEAVVAMTFTRKAAAEMRDRVVAALDAKAPGHEANEYDRTTYQLAAAVLRQDARHNWFLKEDPTRLQIQTIDSLCAMLTRRMPVLSHLGGSPRVRENPDELYHLAARSTMSRLAEGSPEERGVFHRIALHFDNNLATLESQIAKMLAKREQWRGLRNYQLGVDVQDFCDLLTTAEHCLRDVFSEVGEVDFTEITRAAIKALGGAETPSDLLYWLDYRIQHLLVDEFQDTSVSQYKLIHALTGQWSDGDGRTLFVVGDPMQSIYRFREAEVAFFLHCWHKGHLGNLRLHPLRLTANFRSTPEVVQWTQETFAPIMDVDDTVAASVALRPAEAMRPPGGPKPELFRFIDDNGDAEAQKVVELTRASLKHGDVAILVRGRSHLGSILPALRKANIRYEAVEIDKLCEEQYVLDLISLTRAILHVGDRVSWLACLRAPWLGLSLAELSDLAEPDPKVPIVDVVPGRVGEILREAVAWAGRVPLRGLVERTWIALGGPACLSEESQREDVQTFLDVLEEFEQGGTIRDFSLLDERLQWLFAKPASGADCKVMTIHGAKGLEFGTVIVPQLQRGGNSNDRDLLVWSERVDADEDAVLKIAVQPQRKANDPVYDEIKQELDLKEQNEVKRLFYVAATRARNRLYLTACAKPNKDRTQLCTPPSGSFLRLIWPVVQNEFESDLRARRVSKQLALPTERVNIVRHLPAGWKLPQFEHSVYWRPQSRRAVASASKVNYEWVSGTGRHIGTVVHDAMKRMAAGGLWSGEQIRNSQPRFTAELRRLGVAEVELAEATGRVVRGLMNTIGSVRGRWILSEHRDARSEWSLQGIVADRTVSGIIDRTFRDEQGRRWIIDYKTSEHEGGDLAGFLQKQFDQYRNQLETYGVLVSRLTSDPILLGLYFPMLDAWREWEFEGGVAAPAFSA